MAGLEREVGIDHRASSRGNPDGVVLPPRGGGPWRWLLVAVAVVGALAVGFLAGRAVLPPEPELVADERPVVHEVGEGTVGRSLSLSVVASVAAVPVATAGVSGMVTELLLDRSWQVEVGEVVLRVDERPMVVTAGEVPYFRELGPGAVGRDVEQLQRFLTEVGQVEVEVDGRWAASTSSAVTAWRQSLGLSERAVIEQGLLVAVGELPAVLALAEEVAVGELVDLGRPLLERVDATPRFYLPLRLEQAELVPLDAQVRIRAGDRVWEATAIRAVQGPEDIEVELVGPDGGAPCGEDCAAVLSTAGETIFPADVVVVPETSGPVVPVAAVVTSANGATMVTLVGGELREVEVVAAADGLAIVAGVEIGERIELRPRP